MSFTHALKWSFLSELAAKAIQPMVFIVLARLLSPEDFGVMTAAMMVIAFSQIFWEAGMGKALIQRQTHIEEAANAAFMINVGLGALIAGLLYLFAKPIAQTFFQDDRVTAVLQVMTLQVLLGALSSVQTALLQREMDFKKLFWVRFATVSLPGLASIPLAWNGWGYWALVAGTLAGQFAQVIMLWWMSHWRPDLNIDIKVTSEVSKFGFFVGLTGILTWFYSWVDSLIIGMYFGAHDLGVYRIASQIVSMIFSLLFSPILPVVYAHLVKSDEKNQRSNLRLLSQGGAIGASIIAYILVLTSGALESYLLGPQWHGIASLLIVMSIYHAVAYTYSMNGEFYRASGKPQYEVVPMVIGVVFFLPVYLIAVRYDLLVFVYSRLVLVATIGSVVHMIIVSMIYKTKIYWYVCISVINLVAAACIFVVAESGAQSIQMFIMTAVISMMVPGLVLLISGEARQFILQKLKNK